MNEQDKRGIKNAKRVQWKSLWLGGEGGSRLATREKWQPRNAFNGFRVPLATPDSICRSFADVGFASTY